MDEVEKARIERDAKREAVGHGRHGSAMRRYLRAAERREIKANRDDAEAAPPPETPRTTGPATDGEPETPRREPARQLHRVVRKAADRLARLRR